jgi:hypothetical protein
MRFISILLASLLVAVALTGFPNCESAGDTHTVQHPLFSQSVTVRFNATSDTYVNQDQPNNNMGLETRLVVSAFQAKNRRTFVKYNFSTIPQTTQIVSVTLYIYYNNSYYGQNPTGRTYECARVAAVWYDDNLNWSNQPQVSDISKSNCQVPMKHGWMAWNVTTEVKGIIDHTFKNYGWRVRDASESTTQEFTAVFNSTEIGSNVYVNTYETEWQRDFLFG